MLSNLYAQDQRQIFNNFNFASCVLNQKFSGKSQGQSSAIVNIFQNDLQLSEITICRLKVTFLEHLQLQMKENSTVVINLIAATAQATGNFIKSAAAATVKATSKFTIQSCTARQHVFKISRGRETQGRTFSSYKGSIIPTIANKQPFDCTTYVCKSYLSMVMSCA